MLQIVEDLCQLDVSQNLINPSDRLNNKHHPVSIFSVLLNGRFDWFILDRWRNRNGLKIMKPTKDHKRFFLVFERHHKSYVWF